MGRQATRRGPQAEGGARWSQAREARARKHGAWRAFAPDVFSSASFFDGWKRRIEKGAESRAGLLERARTWLLSVGWRRHGLIDPLEVPVGAEVWM